MYRAGRGLCIESATGTWRGRDDDVRRDGDGDVLMWDAMMRDVIMRDVM